MQGKPDKYTEYSKVTGITKEKGQSELNLVQDDKVCMSDEKNGQNKSTVSQSSNIRFEKHIPKLMTTICEFAIKREWEQYHKPTNLMLALVGEVGQLAEPFLWKKDQWQHLTEVELDKIRQEIADVTIYLIRLADVSNIAL